MGGMVNIESADSAALRLRKCEDAVAHERANMHRALRNYEREHVALKEKVEDLWKQLPLTEALLTQQDNPDGATDRGLKPLNELIHLALNKSLEDFRGDVLRNFSEVQGELGSKASADELTLLRDRVNRWARSGPAVLRSPNSRSTSPPMRVPVKTKPFTQ